jgi:ATP-dependent DNA helicase RecG
MVSLNVKGVTENGVKSILQALRQKGLLTRVGPDKGGHWEMVWMEKE